MAISALIPSADLAPSVTSRVLLVRAVDFTEGAPATGSITFELPWDVDVKADGVILKAGKQTLDFDANGEMRIRVPTSDPDTNPDAWFLVVRKSWAPHPYAIRVPVGTTVINLVDCPLVEELPANAAPGFFLTGAGATIKTGGQASVTTTVAGGVATFDFTLPEIAWTRGTLSAGTDPNTLSRVADNGSWGLSTSGAYPNMPYVGAGTLTVVVAGVGSGYQEISRYASTDVWRRVMTNPYSNPVQWGPWARSDANTFKGVIPAGSLNALDTIVQNGTWALSSTATYIDAPFAGSGQVRVDLTSTGPGYQEAVQYSTGRTWRRPLTDPFSTPKAWGAWEQVGGTGVLPVADSDPGAPLETDLTTLTMWGDSLTAAGGIVARLGALLPAVTVFNRGISGQNAEQIAARQGAAPALLTVAGNVIPASGGVAVTARSVPILAGTGFPAISLTGYLAGVHGALSNQAGGTVYTFTRTNAGVAVACPDKTPFITDHSRAARRNAHIIWAGRNNYGLPFTLPCITQMAAYQSPAHKRVVVMGITNAPTEGKGTVEYGQITAINNQLCALLGECFIDVRRWLIDSGLAAVGITPTADDTTAIAADAVPGSLTTDGVHFTTAAQAAIGDWVHARLVALGWYS